MDLYYGPCIFACAGVGVCVGVGGGGGGGRSSFFSLQLLETYSDI